MAIFVKQNAQLITQKIRTLKDAGDSNRSSKVANA
jgi:hypothetical protein